MENRKKMIDFALARMARFTLEGSSDSDNRSIFGFVKSLILSANGETLADCRKPLAVVLTYRVRASNERFHGIKLELLQRTIETLFGSTKVLLSDNGFAGYDRSMLLDYLETCRRIFISQYALAAPHAMSSTHTEPERETELQRAFRLAQERSQGKQG